jgi:small subunit ribosomal protein S8
MSLNDPLANALSRMLNSEKVGKSECDVFPSSKIIINVLEIMKTQGYAGEFKVVEDSKGNYLKVKLLGTINKCGVIKPRFSVAKEEFERFEKRYLPAKNFGFMVVSTSKGMMTHTEAKEKKIGGKLIAYCY